MSGKLISRRDFLSRSAKGATFLALSTATGLASSKAVGANDRLRVGIIGTGNRGTSLMREVLGLDKVLNLEVSAVCDTWKVNLQRAADMVKDHSGKQPRKFTRYEDLLA